MSPWIRAITHVAMLAALALLQACATPVEIKNASQKQLELVGSLDDAVRDLQGAVDHFYRDHADLTRIEGRVQIAQAAILEATDEQTSATADELFERFETEVHPWIRNAFAGPALDERIAALNNRIQQETDATTKLLLQRDLNDLRLQRSDFSSAMPASVASIDAETSDRIKRSASTAADVRQSLDVLRKQIALMRAMQSRVDAWLAIDVSPSQEQIDGLTKSIREAHVSVSGGGE